MKKFKLSFTRSEISCIPAGRMLIVFFAIMSMSLNLIAQTANLTQDYDADFNKGYMNDMVVTGNTVILPFKATSWGGFTSTTSLPKALRNHRASYWNKQVFVTGGLEVIGHQLGVEVVDYSKTVYVADVNSGLSGWREETPLPVGVSEHATVISDGYIFVIGGMSNDLPSNKIYFSKLRADGSLRAWEESTTLLPAPLWGHTAEAINGRLFVAGGCNTADTSAVNTVYSSHINPDGTLTAFTTETNVLPAKRNNHSMVAHTNRLYVLGGYDETLVPKNTIYYADVSINGTLGTWQTASSSLPEPLFGHSSTIQNGILTVIGGYNDNQYYAIQYGYSADINTAPSFTWTQSGLYFEHWASGDAFATDGKIYTVGGYDIFNNTLSQCFYNSLNLSGTLRTSSGRFVSQVFELGINRNISSLQYKVLNSSNHSFYYRTAAEGLDWSAWTDSTNNADISINGSKRYVQYLFEIAGVSGNHQEALDSAQLIFSATQLSGVISSNQNWTLANSPYWVTGDVTIDNNATITVEAGVSLTFGEGTKLEVQNAVLNCNGTSGNPVTFTSFTGEDGYWKGLHFTAGSNGHNSVMDYVVIENAGFQSSANLNVYSTNQPTISNGTLQKGTNRALYVNAGWPVLNNVSFLNNKGNVIEVEAGGTGEINNPVFTGNTSPVVLVIGSTFFVNALWDNFGLDYHISGNIIISAPSYSKSRLTIDKGLTLKFANGTGIEVGTYNFYAGGELWAEGTANPDSLITFTSLNGQVGGWNGIYFSDYSDIFGAVSSLKYCLFEKGKDYNISVYYSNQLTIANSAITNSLHKGLVLNNASASISNSQIYGNPEEGLYGTGQCDVNVTGSTFYSNAGSGFLRSGQGNGNINSSNFYDNGGNGFMSTGQSSGSVIGSNFYNNGGVGYSCGGSMSILNCNFHNNVGTGLQLTAGGIQNVENCVIQDNGNNGLYVADCDPDFVNVDVLNNTGHGFLMNANVWPEYYDLVLSGNATNDFRVSGGTINHNITWQVGQYPFIIIGTFGINGPSYSKARLTLAKGMTLRFAPGAGIEVGTYNIYAGGELWAEGSADPDSIITFTSLNGEVGGWNGIQFNDYSDIFGATSLLKYCLIEKAKDYNIYVYYSYQPVIENCDVTNSLHKGFILNNGSPTITNCNIFGHPEQGLYGTGQCDATILNSDFYDNLGGGFISGQSNAGVTGSSFYNNGGDGFSCGGNLTILNSDLHDNGGAGMRLTGGSPTIENVVVQNNGGFGLWVTDCDPDFVNVDVLNNAGYGFYMNANVWPEYFDLVMSGNATNDFRISGGIINHNITWQVGQYPFIVMGSFAINGPSYSKSRLTLEKGMTLRFAPGAGIEVGSYNAYAGGELWAEGAANPDSLVTFTSLNGEVGGWNGIHFNDYSDIFGASSSLKHCIIEKGNNYNVYSYSTNQPLIDSTVIRESGKYGIQMFYSTPTISNSQIVNNSSYGILIESGSSPVIGNTMGSGNDLFNNGQYEIYNNSSNDIQAAENFWGTTDDAKIQERIYDINDNGSKGTVLYSTASAQSTGLLGQYASLAARYANQPGTILDNVLVTATGLSETYNFTSRTNQDGYSTFTNLADQSYVLSYITDKPWAGVNGTDALKVMQHFASINTLTDIHLAAADVNASESVNSTDAMLIMQRFVHIVDSFSTGDWIFQVNGGSTLNISGSGISDTINGLCFGDVNGSYLPASQLKSVTYPVSMSRKGVLSSASNLIDLPVFASKEMQAGAISLEIYYPDELLKVEDVRINQAGGQLLFSAEKGRLLIAWFSLNPLKISTEDPLFYITVNLKNLDATEQDLGFLTGTNCELADAGATSIPGIELFYPAVVKSTSTSIAGTQVDAGFGLNIYPNPFSANTSLNYTLPEKANVSLKIYNSLGKVVDVVVEENRNAGTYLEKWDAKGQVSGIYYYILEANTGNDMLRETGKIILKRQ